MADDIVNTPVPGTQPYDVEEAKDCKGADAPEMAEVKDLRFAEYSGRFIFHF